VGVSVYAEAPTEHPSITKEHIMYNLEVSRAHSGFNGTYDTLDEVISRLEAYIKDFPNEVVKVTIVKHVN
jgi:hypothetical protein